ncbi:helix-turn-helix transcriptional regulator [Candidatus Poribacteria bacterium]|nr:helix-turn-helix transcriptional regulator [Candidatus Poribacteria bacterium]MYB66010.1 helix-turn-helix transcriptional regulator [Candidatus Poribacteria bacterium]MYF56075.1 helix-turn-helix transcriptional regulator [Candidatus Poribacteria bacterium]
MKKKKNEILAYLFQEIECRGRTQTDVADELGYSQQYISKYIQDHQDRWNRLLKDTEREISLYKALIEAVKSTPVVVNGGIDAYVERIESAIDAAIQEHKRKYPPKQLLIPVVFNVMKKPK